MGVTETLRILLTIFLSTACIQNVRLCGYTCVPNGVSVSLQAPLVYSCLRVFLAGFGLLAISQVMHICVSKLSYHLFRWWLAACTDISLIGPLRTNFNEITMIFPHKYVCENVYLRMSQPLIYCYRNCESLISEIPFENNRNLNTSNHKLALYGWWGNVK